MGEFGSFEEQVRQKIKDLGKLLGFEVDEEWAPSTLREKSRRDIPRIDIVWFKKMQFEICQIFRDV